ncbi:MAG TPA: hypothetical protein VLC12_05275 [Terriglobales bacterium]|nr:hypothetical protein [Terriglobales bacterium]
MHPFIKWTLVVLTPFALWILLSAVRSGHLRPLYERHVRQTRRERIFLASLSFFLGFALVRLLTHAIRDGFYHNLSLHGRHIHHLVWGILLLLLVGYSWLLQVGTGQGGYTWLGRLTAILYGLGAALTLDEYALWLNLRDVYWEREGQASIHAVIFFGGLLSVGIWGGPFLRALTRDAVRLLRGRARAAAAGR